MPAHLRRTGAERNPTKAEAKADQTAYTPGPVYYEGGQLNTAALGGVAVHPKGRPRSGEEPPRRAFPEGAPALLARQAMHDNTSERQLARMLRRDRRNVEWRAERAEARGAAAAAATAAAGRPAGDLSPE